MINREKPLYRFIVDEQMPRSNTLIDNWWPLKKIALQPGESKSVQVSIEAEDLSYYNVTTSEFELEPGQIFLEFW